MTASRWATAGWSTLFFRGDPADADDVGVGFADRLHVFPVIVDGQQDRSDRFETGATLIVGEDDRPRRDRGMREAQHLFLCGRVVVEALHRGDVDVADLPLLERIVAALVEA